MQAYSPLTEHNKYMVVEELFLLDRRKWNMEKIDSILPDLRQTIIAIKPSLTGANDQFAWLGQPTCIYSVKSGYYTTKERDLQHVVINLPEVN